MARACHSPASSIRPSLGYQLQPLREGGFAGMEREQNAIDLLGLVELTLAVHGPSEHGRRRLGGRRIDRRRGGMCSANIGAACRLRRWPAPVRNANASTPSKAPVETRYTSGRLWRPADRARALSGIKYQALRSRVRPRSPGSCWRALVRPRVQLPADGLRARPGVPIRCHDAAAPDGTSGEARAP